MTKKIINIGKNQYIIHNMENGKSNGLVEVFDEKNEKLYEFIMVNQQIQGSITIKSPNKTTKINHFSLEGIHKDIIVEEFDRENHLKKRTEIEELYKGKLNKKTKIEDYKEKKTFIGNFITGVLNGDFQQISGKKIIKGIFVNGEKHGPLTSVSKDKSIETNFNKNILDGKTIIKLQNKTMKVKMDKGEIHPSKGIRKLISLIFKFFKWILNFIYKVIEFIFEIIFEDIIKNLVSIIIYLPKIFIRQFKNK
jgi:hypothetical protein